jgi:hypothetical protein
MDDGGVKALYYVFDNVNDGRVKEQLYSSEQNSVRTMTGLCLTALK